jgi:hypothetical protein
MFKIVATAEPERMTLEVMQSLKISSYKYCIAM